MIRLTLVFAVLALVGCASDGGYRYQRDGYWTAPVVQPQISGSIQFGYGYGYGHPNCFGARGFAYSPYAWNSCNALAWHGPWRYSHWHRYPSAPAPATSSSRAADRARALALDSAAHGERWQRYEDLAPRRDRDDGGPRGAALERGMSFERSGRATSFGGFGRSSSSVGGARNTARSATMSDAVE